MRQRGGGSILTVGWCWGDSGDPAEALARDTAQAAATALTRRLDALHGEAGVQARAVCPIARAEVEAAADPLATLIDRDASAERIAEQLAALAATPAGAHG